MTSCLQVIYNMLNEILRFVTPWGMEYGVVIIGPAVLILMVKGVKKLL